MEAHYTRTRPLLEAQEDRGAGRRQDRQGIPIEDVPQLDMSHMLDTPNFISLALQSVADRARGQCDPANDTSDEIDGM